MANRVLYTPAEDAILTSLLQVRHSIKLSVKALEEAGYNRSQLSVEARRKKLLCPSRRYIYNNQKFK